MRQLPLWKRPYSARRVLDIGAGHNPFRGATHVVDADRDKGDQRGRRELVVPRSARLIIGDAMALPFRSGAFDFVYASHVLEHMTSPASACREIMRVGKSGYIETPSPLLEQGLALGDTVSPEQGFHRWLVFTTERDVLVFEPKTTETVSSFCSCRDGQFLREFFAAVDFRNAQHCFPNRSKNTMFYWSSSFRVEVQDHMIDCRKDGRPCRFQGMRDAIIQSCNSLLLAPRLLRLRRTYPHCRTVLRKYGYRTVFI